MTEKDIDSEAQRKDFGEWLIVDEPRLGVVGMIVLILFAGLVTPFAMDMYTPAIPQMVDALSTNEAMVNLTLVGFVAASAIGLLLFGTISDKYGRKPVLLAGAIAYSLGSFLCAFVQSDPVLIDGVHRDQGDFIIAAGCFFARCLRCCRGSRACLGAAGEQADGECR